MWVVLSMLKLFLVCYEAAEVLCKLIRGVKSTWKPYLSKSTDTLQWKLHQFTKSPIPKQRKRIRVSDFNST